MSDQLSVKNSHWLLACKEQLKSTGKPNETGEMVIASGKREIEPHRSGRSTDLKIREIQPQKGESIIAMQKSMSPPLCRGDMDLKIRETQPRRGGRIIDLENRKIPNPVGVTWICPWAVKTPREKSRGVRCG